MSPVTEIQTLPLMSILTEINHLPPLPHATSYVKRPHGYDLTDVKTIHAFRPRIRLALYRCNIPRYSLG